MTDISQANWSPTDAANNSAAPDGAPEGMPPSGVNDTMRAIMGAVRRTWERGNATLTTAGAGNAYTLAPAVAYGAYTRERWTFLVDRANTGAVTLNISGLGAKTVTKPTPAGPAALAAGDWQANMMVDVVYDGTQFQMVSPVGVSAFTGGTLTSTLTMAAAAINEAAGADIASAATTDIGAATGNYVNVTGTTTITALGTVQAGTRRIVRFAGALTLTHNATSLILPTGANITTAANDVAQFVSLGSGNWRCAGYMRADGTALNVASLPAGTIVQRVTANPYTANTNLSAQIPYDDTIPQNTEGTQILTLTITPKSASNKILLRFQGFFASSGANGADAAIAALFRNSTVNAIGASAVGCDTGVAESPAHLVLELEDSPGTTVATTYSLRVGASAAVSFRANGTSAARRFGGVAQCTLVAEEVAA